MSQLIDTHAHLYYSTYKEDLSDVVQRAKEAGVGILINIGTDLKTNELAIKQSKSNLEISDFLVYSTIGVHPHDAYAYTTDESIHQNIIGKLEKLYQSSTEKIIGIGECGLDFFFEGNKDYLPTSLPIEKLKELQIMLFKAQIKLAKKISLPLVIHCRDAWDDIFIEELRDSTGVFHSFTGTLEQAQKALDLGFYLGFSCMVTYPKNENLREIIKVIPLDRILTETDAPFLPPQDKRGQRNEPANVVEVVKTIAEVKGLSFEEISQQTLDNANKLFKLS